MKIKTDGTLDEYEKKVIVQKVFYDYVPDYYITEEPLIGANKSTAVNTTVLQEESTAEDSISSKFNGTTTSLPKKTNESLFKCKYFSLPYCTVCTVPNFIMYYKNEASKFRARLYSLHLTTHRFFLKNIYLHICVLVTMRYPIIVTILLHP